MSGERSHDPNSSAENLLTTPGDTTNGMSGYMNHAGPNSVPSSPPPSYQHVLEETRLAALSENNRTPNKSHRHHLLPRQASADSVSNNSSSCHSSPNNVTATATRARLSRRSNTLSSNDSVSVTVDRDTECEKHIAKGECWQDFEDFEQQKTSTVAAEANEWQDFSQEPNRGKENFDSQNGGDMWQDYQEPSTSYDTSSRQFDESSIATLAMSQCGDPDGVDHRHDEDMEAELDEAEYETIGESETEEERRQEEYECKLRQQQPLPEGYIEVANKTSKEMYLAMAKEMGIVCRMSDQCRCLDCQGGYLECGEGDGGDENIKTDGGLGAGTPMFVSEAFGHGMAPACAIL